MSHFPAFPNRETVVKKLAGETDRNRNHDPRPPSHKARKRVISGVRGVRESRVHIIREGQGDQDQTLRTRSSLRKVFSFM